ncbi:Topoisomerase (DNA) II binding protein 1, partial [Perkinsus olseni]
MLSMVWFSYSPPAEVDGRQTCSFESAKIWVFQKFSGQQFQQAVDEALKGEGRRVVGRPYYEKYLSTSSDPRPDIPVIYDDILEGQKVSTTGLPLPQREQISRLLPWMGGYDRRELTEDLDILICGSVDLKNAKYRAAAHDLKAALKLPAFIDECWKLKARPHDERKFALKVFQGMRFCFLGTSTEVRAHFKSVTMSNGAASVESRLEQCDVAVIDDVFNETALEEATRRGVIVAPTAWIEKCSAEGRTVPVEGEFKPQSMREILKQTKVVPDSACLPMLGPLAGQLVCLEPLRKEKDGSYEKYRRLCWSCGMLTCDDLFETTSPDHPEPIANILLFPNDRTREYEIVKRATKAELTGTSSSSSSHLLPFKVHADWLEHVSEVGPSGTDCEILAYRVGSVKIRLKRSATMATSTSVDPSQNSRSGIPMASQSSLRGAGLPPRQVKRTRTGQIYPHTTVNRTMSRGPLAAGMMSIGDSAGMGLDSASLPATQHEALTRDGGRSPSGIFAGKNIVVLGFTDTGKERAVAMQLKNHGANLEALTGFGTSNVFAYVLEDGTSAPPNASSESLQVSARWVLGCAESQSLLPVSSSVLYKPCCSRLPLPRFTGVSAMLTDKNKEIFEETKRLVRALGGRAYTTAEVRNSSPGIRISHIICYDSAQVTTRQNLINWAKKCKAIIVFTEWLYACLRQGERVSEQPFTLVLHQEPKRKSLGGSEILPLRGFTVYIEGDGEDLSELDALIDSTGAA